MNDMAVNKPKHSFNEQILSRLKNRGIRKKDEFSHEFEARIPREERSKFGQFFTPVDLVDQIYSLIPLAPGNSIMDPTCGAGAFFLNSSNLGVEKVQYFGADISDIALEFCKEKLERTQIDAKLLKIDTINDLSISSFPSIESSNGVDVIVGNPPFQNLKKMVDYDPKDPLYTEICTGIVNASSLVLRKSLELLKNDGWLGFVLPKNILRVQSFKGIRNYILKNTLIHEIIDLGHYFKDVRGDQIILILQKSDPKLKNNLNHNTRITINPTHRGGTKIVYFLSQASFSLDSHWPVYLHSDVMKLNKKLSTFPQLNSISSGIFRGLPLGSNHEMVHSAPSIESMKLVRGDSINRFKLKYTLSLSSQARDLVDSNLFERQESDRIAIQNIVSREGGIKASLIDSETYSLDTVTNIILNEDTLNQYIMGILNSRICNFFILIVLYLHSNFTMHADKGYVGKLPIAIPDIEQRKKVERIVDELEKTNQDNSEKFWQLYEQLNLLIYQIYNLDPEEISLIERTLSKVMSVKSNG